MKKRNEKYIIQGTTLNKNSSNQCCCSCKRGQYHEDTKSFHTQSIKKLPISRKIGKIKNLHKDLPQENDTFPNNKLTDDISLKLELLEQVESIDELESLRKYYQGKLSHSDNYNENFHQYFRIIRRISKIRKEKEDLFEMRDRWNGLDRNFVRDYTSHFIHDLKQSTLHHSNNNDTDGRNEGQQCEGPKTMMQLNSEVNILTKILRDIAQRFDELHQGKRLVKETVLNKMLSNHHQTTSQEKMDKKSHKLRHGQLDGSYLEEIKELFTNYLKKEINGLIYNEDNYSAEKVENLYKLISKCRYQYREMKKIFKK
ncbi:hypothetical protein SNEBB_006940 [Seison nebaliae]|nr:hypothetical protein SNEBB_006940 [Seison nebaliae]